MSSNFTSHSRIPTPVDMYDDVDGPIFHVVSHTHWDREWYLPFESFRGRLVKLIDRIFETMATDEAFKHFHFDGQFIPIEDYLEVRPGMRDTVIQANLEGKISLGPWYIQPDEYLVSAEALVRNLLIGMRLSRGLGGTVKLGYVPDSFGHISQLPQMLRGFGIDNFISGRGPPSRASKPESLWIGPDGSEVLFIYLKAWYCNALEMPADPDPRRLRQYLDKKRKELRESSTKHILLMNGCDHSSPDPRIGSTIAHISESGALPNEQRLVHSNLEDYVAFAQREIDSPHYQGVLKKHEGELRFEVNHLASTLSTKVSQKQMNWALQNLLEAWAEPLSVYTECLGGEPYDQDTLTYAWKKLLQNHPHDSICGCSSKEVHQEVDARFSKVKQVVEGLLNERALKLAKLLKDRNSAHLGRDPIVVFNPTNSWRQEVVVVDIELPSVDSPVMVDAEGRKVSTTMLSAKPSQWSYYLPDIGFRKAVTETRATIAFQATVPPLGYAFYSVSNAKSSSGGSGNSPNQGQRLGMGRPRGGRRLASIDNVNSRSRKGIPGLHIPDAANPRSGKPIPGLHNPTQNNRNRNNRGSRPSRPIGRPNRKQDEAMVGEEELENEYLKVSIYKDGSVDILDKATGLIYPDLNLLMDENDGGDEYKFTKRGAPVIARDGMITQPVRTSTGQVVRVSPSGLGGVDPHIFFLLSKGSRRLEVRVELDNKKHGHRLKARFHLRGDGEPIVFADGQFEVLKRKVSAEVQPQYRFTTLVEQRESVSGDPAAGLTIATRGLHEYTQEFSEGTMCQHITLIRSTDRLGDWMKVSPVPTAQEQGTHALEYAIIPHARSLAGDAAGARLDALPRAAQFDLDAVARGFNFRMHAVSTKGFRGFVPEPQINIWRSEVAAFAALSRRAEKEGRAMFNQQRIAVEQQSSNIRGRRNRNVRRITFSDNEGEHDALLDYTNLPNAPDAAESFIRLNPSSLVISAIKRKEDGSPGTIVRFYNPYGSSVLASIGSALPVEKAWRTNLAEERQNALHKSADGDFAVEVGPKQIVTVEFE